MEMKPPWAMVAAPTKYVIPVQFDWGDGGSIPPDGMRWYEHIFSIFFFAFGVASASTIPVRSAFSPPFPANGDKSRTQSIIIQPSYSTSTYHKLLVRVSVAHL
jgi:hypothetical protein